MKPRANLGNRTRQPKGCANRIAKPARQCRTSQNHLMMIILNKTGATTVAQLDFETLAIHAQSETRGCRRHVLCANFSKTRALFLLLSHRPQQRYRAGGSPTGGVCCMVQHWHVCAIVFWRVVWYRAGTFLCMRSWPCMSWPRRARRVRPSCRGRGVPGCGRGRGRGCGVVICVAVARLRHADEC